MPRMLYSLTDRIVDLVTSQAAKTAPMVIFVLVQCVLRICILRPLIIFCCMILAVLIRRFTVLPDFWPDNAAQRKGR